MSQMPILQYREPEPQSISHWGMIALPMPPFMMVNFRMSDEMMQELTKPGHIVWMTPCKH